MTVRSLIIDPACTLIFEAEAAEADVMQRPPRPPGERLFSLRTVAMSILQGLSVLAVCLLVGRGDALALLAVVLFVPFAQRLFHFARCTRTTWRSAPLPPRSACCGSRRSSSSGASFAEGDGALGRSITARRPYRARVAAGRRCWATAGERRR